MTNRITAAQDICQWMDHASRMGPHPGPGLTFQERRDMMAYFRERSRLMWNLWRTIPVGFRTEDA